MNLLKKLLICLLLIPISITTLAQSKITGKVVSADGDPIIGASVSVKGTTIGSVTDLNGDFSLDVATGVLVVSYLGYFTQEIPIRGQSSFNIVLEEDTKSLDEVIVVGYGTQKKASLTSAIAQVSGEEAFKDRGLNNVTVALQGEMPGLIVTRTSTRPGSENVAMKIRGDISVNGNSAPLVLIDGMSASLDELNQMDPNDIENVTILKDASAAIYGARSASGVLLVTTKRGKKGATKVSYSGLFSRTMDGISPEWTTNQEWTEMFYEVQYQDARARRPDLTDHKDIVNAINWWVFTAGGTSGGILLDDIPGILNAGETIERLDLLKALHGGHYFRVDKGAAKQIMYKPDTYLMDEMYGNASWQKHSLSISGADDRFGYMASLGFADNQSQLKVARDGEKKYSGRLNADYQANKMLKIETGMSFEKRNVTTPYRGVGWGWEDFWVWPIKNEMGQWYDTWSSQRNPIGNIVDGGYIKNDYVTSRLNLRAILDLSQYIKGLTVSATGGYKNVQRGTQDFRQNVKFYDWVGTYQNQQQPNDELREESRKWENVTIGGFVNYDNLFNNIHSVSMMVGATSEEENYKRIYASRRLGSLYPNSGLVDLSAMISGTTNEAEGGQNSWALLSILTRLKYAYNNKYLVEFLARRDGSSKLHPDQRWKNFFSLSGGWVISQEQFMQDLVWLNFLKLRYNYGRTGSVEGIDNYERYSTIASGSSYFGAGTTLAAQPFLHLGDNGGSNGSARNTMTSFDRTWETIEKQNFGVDYSFLKNRLSGSFEVFSNTNNGMFIPVTYPAVLGAIAPKTNNGKFQTKGWEFSLDWKNKIGEVTYRIGGFLADATSTVLELENNENMPSEGINRNRLIGKPRDAIYVWKTDGIFQTQEEVTEWLNKYYWVDPSDLNKGSKNHFVKNGMNNPGAATGEMRLRPGARRLYDTNGDETITLDDLVYAGDAAPHLLFGIKAGLEWKGIDFNAFFQGVSKQVVLRSAGFVGPWNGGIGQLQHTTAKGKMWSDVAIPNPFGSGNLVDANTSTNYTVPCQTVNFNRYNYWNNDISVQNSSYIRLKSLVVGYTVPQTITQKVGISKARLYFSGDDLWELTKVKDGFDPEFGEATNNTFPFSRLISFGLDVTF